MQYIYSPAFVIIYEIIKNGGGFCNVTVGRQRVWSNYGDSDAAIQTAKHGIMGYPSLIMADQVVS